MSKEQPFPPHLAFVLPLAQLVSVDSEAKWLGKAEIVFADPEKIRSACGVDQFGSRAEEILTQCVEEVEYRLETLRCEIEDHGDIIR